MMKELVYIDLEYGFIAYIDGKFYDGWKDDPEFDFFAVVFMNNAFTSVKWYNSYKLNGRNPPNTLKEASEEDPEMRLIREISQ